MGANSRTPARSDSRLEGAGHVLGEVEASDGGIARGLLRAIGSLFAFVSPAWSEPYPNVPTPTVEGPIAVTPTSHPFLATEIPLAHYGYTEEEYFISGTGYTYKTSGAVNETGTKILTGGPNGNGTYPFKTRIVVRMPTNPADFNGKVIVEWNNVTAGYDLEVNWFGDPYFLLKNGYAYVTVSAQNVGVNYLKKFNPGTLRQPRSRPDRRPPLLRHLRRGGQGGQGRRKQRP